MRPCFIPPAYLFLLLAVLDASVAFSILSKPAVPKATTWKFRNHDIYSQVTSSKKIDFFNSKPDVLLVHGFGCSTVYWRETIASLAEDGYTVHALDLLGQGKSEKPGRKDGVEYSINLWAELIDEYAKENMPQSKGIVLMGNSLGSLVALSAATGDYAHGNGDTDSTCFIKSRIKGVGMFNCGIGLNSRNIAKEPQWSPTQAFLLNRVFDLLNLLIFNNLLLLDYILTNVVTRELLRDALIGLYPCATDAEERVDEALVDSFYLPAKEQGSVEALSQIYTNDAGATPMEIHDRHGKFLENVPIHLVWGNADAVTPISGGLGQYYIELASAEDSVVTLETISSGHIPFDEVPEVANGSMLEWLNTLGNKR